MTKALLLIFWPARTWDGIALAGRGFLFVFFLFFTPLIALSMAGELLGRPWVIQQFKLEHVAAIPQDLAIRYGTAEVVFAFAAALLCAYLVKSMAETFHTRHTYGECFRVVAYALSPLFLFHLLDAIPAISPWLSFTIGIFFAVAALYHGIPRVLKPDPPHAFGLFLMSALFLIMVTGLARLVTVQVLQKKLNFF